MKTNAIIRIVLFSLAILVLASILLGVLTYEIYSFSFNLGRGHSKEIEEVTEQIDIEYIMRDVHNIEIEWVAGSITLQKDPNVNEIQVCESSPIDSKYTMVLKQSGQTLKIRFCEDDIGPISLGIDADVSKDLMITVPADWECGSLEIDTAAAEVVIQDLTIGEFDFDGASGVCEIINCNVGEVDIDTASGDVYFSGTLDTLDCDAASADCTIEVTNIPRSIDLDGISGNLELILPPDAGFICKLDTLSGSFDSDFTFSTHSDTYVCGSGECKINAKAMSGDVNILKGNA